MSLSFAFSLLPLILLTFLPSSSPPTSLPPFASPVVHSCIYVCRYGNFWTPNRHSMPSWLASTRPDLFLGFSPAELRDPNSLFNFSSHSSASLRPCYILPFASRELLVPLLLNLLVYVTVCPEQTAFFFFFYRFCLIFILLPGGLTFGYFIILSLSNPIPILQGVGPKGKALELLGYCFVSGPSTSACQSPRFKRHHRTNISMIHFPGWKVQRFLMIRLWKAVCGLYYYNPWVSQ